MASGYYAPTRPLLAHEMALQQQVAAQQAFNDQLLDWLRDISARLGRLEARE